MAQQNEVLHQATRTVSSDADSGCALDEYTWVPPGLTAQQVYEYMHSLPVQCVPYAGGSIGDRWRATQLLRQLPPQDTEVRYCHGLSDEEKRELRLFSAQRRHDSLGRATVLPLTMPTTCHQCGDAMHTGELAVYASRAMPGMVWHPACFTCSVCLELLVDLIYFYSKDAQLYCGRHHAETLKPRCCACDEIIFSDECTEAEGHSWHTKHFVCCDCESPLGGQRYIMTDGRPFCCVCYERLYSAECATCRQKIHVIDGHMVHGSRRWHAVDSCFRCDLCASSLLGCPFVAVPGKDAIFCADCGITYKATDSASYMNKFDGIMGGNCLSPSSPMMKVREPSNAAFHSNFDDRGQDWSEETPLKAASSKFFSPQSSPLQCKPLAVEPHTQSQCIDPASCCDDHRLSAEFQACITSREDPNTGTLPPELSSKNEKPLTRISPVKNAVNSLRFGTESRMKTSAVDDANASPRPPLLVAHGADFLDNAEVINAGLEELIVEPLWNRKEPEGLAAEGTDDVVGVPDDVGQKSRKSKNLNVRFDPSTKDPCSPPVSHGAYCERWHPSSGRSLDDSDISYMPCGSHCHAVSQNGSASVRVRRRKFGHGQHRAENGIWAGNHRASMNQGWWIDDGEHCSTCSSSSSDSEFDYSSAAFSSRSVPVHSQTLPRHHTAGTAGAIPLNQQVQHSRKHKKKHCTLS